jgi:hypothetical protein
MHDGKMADPLNKHAKAIKKISAKRQKTDADHEQMSKLEFLGAMYTNDDGVPCIPGTVIEATLRTAAKKKKQGKQCTEGLRCIGTFALEYDGPKDPEEMWEAAERFADRRVVRVQTSRTMRTRPVFPEWKVGVTVEFDDEIINKTDVDAWMETAGRVVGMCDYRPTFGTFSVEAR